MVSWIKLQINDLRYVTLRYDTYSLIADDQEDSRSEVASEDIALDR
jgi:hypothetical protein